MPRPCSICRPFASSPSTSYHTTSKSMASTSSQCPIKKTSAAIRHGITFWSRRIRDSTNLLVDPASGIFFRAMKKEAKILVCCIVLNMWRIPSRPDQSSGFTASLRKNVAPQITSHYSRSVLSVINSHLCSKILILMLGGCWYPSRHACLQWAVGQVWQAHNYAKLIKCLLPPTPKQVLCSMLTCCHDYSNMVTSHETVKFPNDEVGLSVVETEFHFLVLQPDGLMVQSKLNGKARVDWTAFTIIVASKLAIYFHKSVLIAHWLMPLWKARHSKNVIKTILRSPTAADSVHAETSIG